MIFDARETISDASKMTFDAREAISDASKMTFDAREAIFDAREMTFDAWETISDAREMTFDASKMVFDDAATPEGACGATAPPRACHVPTPAHQQPARERQAAKSGMAPLIVLKLRGVGTAHGSTTLAEVHPTKLPFELNRFAVGASE